ncbi:MAG: hypothetical protein INR66_00660 [Gordonia polyisoprenivorans]|nr:hypothetical protein [Gordonia polyisoprenivorans]
MQCPICGSPSEVFKTAPATPGSAQTARKRVCKGPQPHRFSSIEMAQMHTLEQLGVRRQGDGRIAPFDREKLLDEVRVSVNGVLTEAEVYSVVNGVLEQLKLSLPTLAGWYMPTRPGPRGRLPEATAYIADSNLRDIVEDQLKHAHNRIAHFLYAVAIRGRRDRVGREGWARGAADVLAWVFEEYPDLRTPVPTSPDLGVPEIWRPARPKVFPTFVLKSGRIIIDESSVGDQINRPLERDGQALENHRMNLQEQSGRLVAFSQRRFKDAIQAALHGHPDARHWSTWISWWVLTDLVGQQRVTSSQLSVGVLSCLRRIDDIGYLRWAARMKNIPQVRGLRDEAVELLRHPSKPLQFDPPTSDNRED